MNYIYRALPAQIKKVKTEKIENLLKLLYELIYSTSDYREVVLSQTDIESLLYTADCIVKYRLGESLYGETWVKGENGHKGLLLNEVLKEHPEYFNTSCREDTSDVFSQNEYEALCGALVLLQQQHVFSVAEEMLM